jgi:hypothetical protein
MKGLTAAAQRSSAFLLFRSIHFISFHFIRFSFLLFRFVFERCVRRAALRIRSGGALLYC